jgi:hypothetical protein
MPEFNAVKDSGERQSFETGAVRDTGAGKGRYDLLPVHALLAVRPVGGVLTDLFYFLEGRRDQPYIQRVLAYALETLAAEEKSSYGDLYRIARHFENGAVKYNDDNWRKGIPLRRYLDSAIRHWCKYFELLQDEDHLAAAAWNLLCLLETEEMIKRGLLPESLNNLPNYLHVQQQENQASQTDGSKQASGD